MGVTVVRALRRNGTPASRTLGFRRVMLRHCLGAHCPAKITGVLGE